MQLFSFLKGHLLVYSTLSILYMIQLIWQTLIQGEVNYLHRFYIVIVLTSEDGTSRVVQTSKDGNKNYSFSRYNP